MSSHHYEPLLPIANQDIYELEGIPQIDHEDPYRLAEDTEICARSLNFRSEDLRIWEEAVKGAKTNHMGKPCQRVEFMYLRLFDLAHYEPCPRFLGFDARRRPYLARHSFARKIAEEMELALSRMIVQRCPQISSPFMMALLRAASQNAVKEYGLPPGYVVEALDIPFDLCHIRALDIEPWSGSRQHRPVAAGAHDIEKEIKDRWKELEDFLKPHYGIYLVPAMKKRYFKWFEQLDMKENNPVARISQAEMSHPDYSPPPLRRAKSASCIRSSSKGDKQRSRSCDEREKWHHDVPWRGGSPIDHNRTDPGRDQCRCNIPISSSRSAESISRNPESYFIVVGWFKGKHNEPKETLLEIRPEDHFLRRLRADILVLRGLRSFFSFKTVQGFSVYQCDPIRNTHFQDEPPPTVQATLAQLFKVYSRRLSYVYIHVADSCNTLESQNWSAWARKNLNAYSDTPFKPRLSLKLELRWSQTRLTIASTAPLIVSFVFGVWYSLKYEDPQTAFTISSYIVTAGAFLIALLAVLSSLKDG